MEERETEHRREKMLHEARSYEARVHQESSAGTMPKSIEEMVRRLDAFEQLIRQDKVSPSASSTDKGGVTVRCPPRLSWIRALAAA